MCEEIQKILAGYSLTTAKILYRIPDHQDILQTLTWQNLDLYPKFPELHKFLKYWEENIDGPLFEVVVAHRQLIRPTEFKMASAEFKLN